jgi:hypothetical protein
MWSSAFPALGGFDHIGRAPDAPGWNFEMMFLRDGVIKVEGITRLLLQPDGRQRHTDRVADPHQRLPMPMDDLMVPVARQLR